MIELLHVKVKRLYKQAKRLYKKLTMNRLAFILSVCRQNVIYMLNGSRRIPENIVEKLAEIFKITKEELLRNTIQITGKKRVVNFSNVKFDSITSSLIEYPGLTKEEVLNVLKYKNQVA